MSASQTDIQQLKADYITTQRAAAQEDRFHTERYAPYAERIAEIQREFAAVNAEFIAVKTEIDTAAARAEEKLRQAIIDNYEATGEKTIDENLSVQVRRSFKYEMSDAVEWAETNAPVMIEKSVNKKSFEKFADGLDFVSVEEKVSSVLKGLNIEKAEAA